MLGNVPSCVQQHIGNRIPYLARRPQHVDVAAIGEHTAGAMEHPVHAARETRGDRLEPASEIPCAARLDDHVNVVALDRVMNEPKAAALTALAPGSLHLGNEPRGPERWNILLYFQRDVTWVARRERRSATVRVPSARPRLSPCTRPRAAPSVRRLELEVELSRSFLHEREYLTSKCQMWSRDDRGRS